MFKKIKESGAIEKFKELRKNPQTKAIMSLGVWMVFFLIIILFTRGIGSNKIYRSESVKKINGYEFTYSNDVTSIFGVSQGKEKLYNVDGKKFYYNGSDVYLVNGHALVKQDNHIGILKIDLDMIDNLTSNLQESDMGEYKRCLIPLSNFLNLFEEDTEVDLTLASTYNIIVDRYYSGSIINMIKIDLSSYYSYRGINNDGILTIDIYNINNVFDLKEYGNMVGGVR